MHPSPRPGAVSKVFSQLRNGAGYTGSVGQSLGGDNGETQSVPARVEGRGGVLLCIPCWYAVTFPHICALIFQMRRRRGNLLSALWQSQPGEVAAGLEVAQGRPGRALPVLALPPVARPVLWLVEPPRCYAVRITGRRGPSTEPPLKGFVPVWNPKGVG